LNPETNEYPDHSSNSEHSTLEYFEPTEQSENNSDPERIEEDNPLEENPNPLSTSEILFGERRPRERDWNPFSFEPETEPEFDLETSFRTLSLDDEPEPELELDNEETSSTESDEMAQPAQEVKLNYPKVFTGKREEAKSFLQSCELYLAINSPIYTTDTKKIGFVLSLMTDRDAASWKDQFVEEHIITSAAANTALNLGTFVAFKHDLQEAFAQFDAPGDALEKMKTLRMKGDDSVDDHVAKFKMMVAGSKIEKDSPVLIDLFRETLPIPLQRRILTLEKPPTELEKWYEWTIKLHHQWKRMQRITERSVKTTTQKKPNNGGSRKFYFSKQNRDPNAMDVDALTTEERNSLLKQGKCFKCKKIGHLAKECPERNYEQTKKKMGGKELHAYIRSLTEELDEEEKDELTKNFEETGF